MHSRQHIRARLLRVRYTPSLRTNGFTLIEILFALILVSIALLALEATTTRTIQRIADSHREALAADLAQQQINRLIASHCKSALGADSVNRVTVQWSSRVTTDTPPTAIITQDIQYPIATGMHVESLNTVIPCR